MRQLIIMTALTLMACASTKNTAMTGNKPMPTAVEQNKTSVRRVSNFTKIALIGSNDVIYTQGKTTSVKVVGKASEVDNILTTVEHGTLVIKTSARGGTFGFRFGSSDDDVKVYVTSPDLTQIRLQGSGDFKAPRKIDSDNLTVTVVGSGDIDLRNVICDNFSLDVRGSGDVEIDKLCCANSLIAIRGSGDIEINEEKVTTTNAEVYGSGDIELHLSQCGTVNCKVFGSGDITLSGTLRHLNKSSKGSGSIHTRSLSFIR